MVGMLLFSYGSNGIAQLSERLRHPIIHSYPAYINNHVRVFCGYSTKWQGGVASIVRAPGHRVYGLLVEVSDRDLKVLDKFETGYTRELRTVHNQETQETLQAMTYIAKDHTFTHMPSSEYLQAIRKMHRDRRTHRRSSIIIRAYDSHKKLIYVLQK